MTIKDDELKVLIGVGDDCVPIDTVVTAGLCVQQDVLASAAEAVVGGGDPTYFLDALVRYFNCNVCGGVCKGGHLKVPDYISPSALSLFRRPDKTEYFIRYLVLDRPPRLGQTQPMAVGSAFDAYVKHEISLALGLESDFDSLFASQVDVEHRDWALVAGCVCMDAYTCSGAMADLLTLLGAADEVDLELVGSGEIAVGGGSCVLYGKPDLKFVINGNPIMLDWKVNGYCSASNTSPKAGYALCRDGWLGKQSRSHGTCHKDAFVVVEDGLSVNISSSFEELYPDWAMQVAPYGWMCGIEVGVRHPAIIHQLACGPAGIRVVQHCAYIGSEYQQRLAAEYCALWKIVHDPTLFWTDDEIVRLVRLAGQYKADEGSVKGQLFAELTRHA